LAITKRRGIPTRFIVQLEYRHDGAWHPVARFDHDESGPAYRNVELVGLHLGVYDPEGVQVQKRMTWRPQPAEDAMGAAEDYLRQQAGRLIRRFEAWL
jgi:hypothetical protein